MRKVLMAVGVVSMVSLAAAQTLEVGIDGGYGLPAGTVLVGGHKTTIDTQTYAPKTYEEVYSPGGKGWKVGGDVVFYPFENVGIIVISGYSMNNRYDTIYTYVGGSNMSTDTVTTSYLPINIGIKIKTKILGILEPYVYVAPGVIFPKKTESLFDSFTVSTTKKTYSYSMGFSLVAGVGAAIMVTDKIGIKAEFTPTYAFASPTKYTQVKKDPNGTATKTFKYVDNTPAQNLHSSATEEEIQNRPHDSFCSMAFKIGVCMKFL